MCLHQVRSKMMIQKTVFMRNLFHKQEWEKHNRGNFILIGLLVFLPNPTHSNIIQNIMHSCHTCNPWKMILPQHDPLQIVWLDQLASHCVDVLTCTTCWLITTNSNTLNGIRKSILRFPVFTPVKEFLVWCYIVTWSASGFLRTYDMHPGAWQVNTALMWQHIRPAFPKLSWLLITFYLVNIYGTQMSCGYPFIK
jgi:hypothetical protein